MKLRTKYDSFQLSRLIFDFFFFECPDLFPELKDIDIGMIFRNDLRTTTHTQSVSDSPHLWSNSNIFWGHKTCVVVSGTTKINSCRSIINDNNVRSTIIDTTITNGKFNRLVTLKMKILLESSQIFNDAR